MKSRTKLFALLIGVGFLIPTGALAQYTINAGENVFTESVEETYIDKESGVEKTRTVEKHGISNSKLFDLLLLFFRERNMRF